MLQSVATVACARDDRFSKWDALSGCQQVHIHTHSLQTHTHVMGEGHGFHIG